jgi:hypothetical protein
MGLSLLFQKSRSPYEVQQTPRGSVVVCRDHLITDEMKPEEAKALAAALNIEHQRKQSV